MRKLGIGVVGCGNIAATYLRNAALFPGIELRACADLQAPAAAMRAQQYGLRALSVEALLAAKDVDLVLNLTVPTAHFDVSMAALTAGKHVFTEKPLAATEQEGRRLVAEARRRGLALGSAPDTFLGAAGRLARRLVDEGAIGRIVTGTAFMMTRGMEHWHPNPQFYYQPGGGPVLDMGPYYLTMLVHLLGPVRRVVARSSVGSTERTITAAGPHAGRRFQVGTPTTIVSLLEFATGPTMTFCVSWDVHRHSNPPIELHGTLGSLSLPDPDTFGGTLGWSEGGAPWREMTTDAAPFGQMNWPYAAPDRANYRMLGVAELARAIEEGAATRASGELALHVLAVAEAMLQAGAGGEAIMLPQDVVRPAALSEEQAADLTSSLAR